MKKLQEINRLVEEAFVDLGIVTRTERQENALNKLARKCAEINIYDWRDSGGMLGTAINAYNSRLRDLHDGQVEEVKQEEKPALQPLPDEVPEWFITSWKNTSGDRTMRIEEWHKIVDHFGTQQSNLQPLPDEMPDWFNTFNGAYLKYNEIRQHFGIKPREWWHNLKKGDKFVYDNGLEKKIKTYNGHYVAMYYLYTTEDGDSIGISVKNCSPYTDPAQSFRDKLTPEMQVEFDKIVSSLTPNTPQP